jgi:hypothetical protein
MEDVRIFYGHLVHFTIFCCILWTFGIVHGCFVFFHFLVFCNKKNLAILPYPVTLERSVASRYLHRVESEVTFFFPS